MYLHNHSKTPLIIRSIIVTHNGSRWIERCLKSLRSAYHENRILLIDNASSDDTVEIAREVLPSTQIISLSENLGFGKANNIGLTVALEEDADCVFLLNQDAWLSEGAIDQLCVYFQESNKFGIISPIHLDGSGRAVDRMFKRYLLESQIYDDILMKKDLYCRVRDVPFVNAAMWLIGKECLRRVGGFDPLFIHYGEDDDYVNRTRFHGFSVGVCLDVIGYHDRENRSEEVSWARLFGARLVHLKDPLNPPQYGVSRLILDSAKNVLRLVLSVDKEQRRSAIASIRADVAVLSCLGKIRMHRNLCSGSEACFL